MFEKISAKVRSEAFKNTAKEVGKAVVVVVATAAVVTAVKAVIYLAHKKEIEENNSNVITN